MASFEYIEQDLTRGGRDSYPHLAALLAETRGYESFKAGDRIATVSGDVYEIADAGVTDHDETNAGGLKLYLRDVGGSVVSIAKGSETAAAGQDIFALEADAPTAAHVLLHVDDVYQEPDVDYTVSGSTLTLETPLAGGETVTHTVTTTVSLEVVQQAADLSQAYAESPTAPDPDSDPDGKSSKTWAGKSKDSADVADDLAEQTAADRVQTGLDRVAASDSASDAQAAAILANAYAADDISDGLANTSGGQAFAVAYRGRYRIYRNNAGAETLIGRIGRVTVDAFSELADLDPAELDLGELVEAINLGEVYQRVSGGGHLDYTGTSGVRLNVLRTGAHVDIRAFGATGNAADDQDAAVVAAANSRLPIYIPAGFVLRFSSNLALQAPWIGAGEGQGSPGSSTDSATGYLTSEMLFTGTGWAIDTRGTFSGICLRSDGVTEGQNGCRFEGDGIGQKIGPIRVLEFDGTAVEFGDSDAESGIFFADVAGVQVVNSARLGQLGVLVQGGGTSSTNVNIFSGIFVSGPFIKYARIDGHANIFLSLDVNPKPQAVADLGGVLDVGVEVGGDGNTFLNAYLEPAPGQEFDTLIRFLPGSGSNHFERVYTPSAGAQIAGLIDDQGTANLVTFAHMGENFTPSVGVPYSEDNLIPNPGFLSVDPTTIPLGWVLGGGSTGTVTVDDTVQRGKSRTLKIETADTRAQVQCYLRSASSPSVRNSLKYYPAGLIAKQTVSVGVWCLSSVAGAGAIKVQAGSTAFGAASHSGSGEWEFLTVRTRADDDPAEVAITMRNNKDFQNNTATVWFSEPVFVLGHDVPKYAGSRKLDAADAAVVGRLSLNPARVFADGDTTPDVSQGNVFRTANTAATNITNFDGGPGVAGTQEIRIRTGDGNTSVANNGNIKTKSNATTALANGVVARFLWDGTKWFEV